MRFGILGPVLVDDGAVAVAVPAARQRVLLAALLVHAGQAVSADALAEVVWDGSPPPAAAGTLRTHVMRLRRVLGPRAGERLVTRYPGYLVEADEDEIDLLRFSRLCRDGSAAVGAGSWRQASQILAEALGLWRGPALADVPSQLLQRNEVPRIDQLRLQAQEWRIDADLHLGRHAELVPELQSLAAEYPLRERFHAHLLLALYRSGRQAEALTAYRQARGALVEELGAEPGPELQQLHQQILTADPALSIAGPATPATGGGAGPGPPAPPRQLPAAVAGFTGRAAELAALTRMLEQAGANAPGTVVISAIGGTAGVGKTALAVHWAHQVVERFPDGQLYVNLRGYDLGQPMPAADALTGFLRSLGVPGQDIPPEEDERAARFRSLLAGRRMLIVLDNARSADQVRPLLPGTPACTVVVTSRDALAGLMARDGAIRLDLDVLPLEEAVAVLRTLIGARVDDEPGAATELANQCCRLPLALRVAAELAASRPAMPLAVLAGELADLRTRLDLLDAGGDRRTEVRTVFSWSYRHLDADDAQTFRLLGLHPGPDVEPYAVAALTATTAPQARRALDVLARAHLLSLATPGRYGMHDLLRGYACELTATLDAGQEQHAALTRLFDYYLRTAAAAMDALFPAERRHRPAIPLTAALAPAVDTRAEALAWLDAERASLAAAVAHMSDNDWPGHATLMAATLRSYLDRGDQQPEAITIYSCALRAARRTGDRAAEAAALHNLGIAAWGQGRYEQAARRFQQALAISAAIADRLGEAREIGHLGLADLMQGRFREAADRFHQTVALCREIGDRLGEARTLGNLGSAYRRLGRYQQATEHQQQSLLLCRELGDQRGHAIALLRLGALDLELGRYQQATDHLQQSLALSREIGLQDSEADALVQLGAVDRQLGRYHQATGHLQQALALFREIGDQASEAQTLNGLGEILIAAGQADHARTRHTTALALASQIGAKNQQARAHDGLGHAYQATGETALARHHWQEALSLYTSIGSAEADQVRTQLGPD